MQKRFEHWWVVLCARAADGYSSLNPKSLVALCTLLMGISLVILGITGSDEVEANRTTYELKFGQQAANAAAETGEMGDAEVRDTDSDEPAEEVATNPEWLSVSVRRGDNLSLIFARAGVSASELQLVLDSADDARELKNIFPGQSVDFRTAEDGSLLSLRYTSSPLEQIEFHRAEKGFLSNKIIREPEIRQAFRHARLSSSLFEAGVEAGLSGRMLMDLANIFGGVLDFVLDPRKGDTFSVLYEEKYLDGEKIGDGAIIAAEYINAGKTYSAFRFTDSGGVSSYFNESGVSMRRAFLRAPLDFTRVSSNFNLRRLHPVAKVVRPHRGVDYAASTGTPVYASGDGKVIASSYGRANGNFVFIQHANGITTRYLHLHKRMVKVGARVRQGQTIGTVGSTGLATGPHLHYEFLVNNVHRNPRTVLDSLPKVASLGGAEMPRFTSSVSGLQRQLKTYSQAWELALASQQPAK